MKPNRTGSHPESMTIGMVVVSCWSALTKLKGPVISTSGRRETSSRELDPCGRLPTHNRRRQFAPHGVFTMLGTPCVNLPGLKGPNSMPIGLLAIGRIDDDKRTLGAANWLSLRLA
jgi:hypothetical protein